MNDDYRSMWADLGMNLDAHDALLAVLGKRYGDIFLSQKDRPQGMGYFDFVMSEVHGLRIKELLDEKADGVIHYGLQFCQPYLMEAIPVEKALEEQQIPCLRIETDYAMEDAGQLKTRIEAFIEQLR